jgi:hypothetical protein
MQGGMDLDTLNAEVLLGDGTEETVPQDILCGDTIFDIQYHPSSDILAAGLVTGKLLVYQYKKTEVRQVACLDMHTDAALNAMEFTEDGTKIVTVGSDRQIQVLDCATQKKVITVKKGKTNPHKMGISAVNICSETVIATGDDDGLVCLWDLRQRSCVAKYHEHADYVSQMLYFSEVNQLLTSSGDTCLGCFDTRAGKLVDMSDPRKDELTCLGFIPATNDIICGAPSGILPIWKYGSWSRPFDAFKGHPGECDSILTYNDNIMITGAYDGILRVIQVYPVRMILCHLGIDRRKGVSRIRISRDRNVLASSSSNNVIHFTDVEFLGDATEVEKLMTRAAARHMATMRDANAREFGDAEQQAPDVDSEEWSTSDSDLTSGSDMESSSEGGDEEEGEEVDAEAPPIKRKKGKGGGGGSKAQHVEPVRMQPETRAEKRAKVQAAQWVKEQNKRPINFKKESGKRRVKGFFGDLVEQTREQDW